MTTDLSVAEPVGLTPPASFASRVQVLRAAHVALWRMTPCETPRLGPLVTAGDQAENVREAERLMDELSAAVLACPDGEGERRAWRERLEARVRLFGTRHLGWPSGYQDLLFADGFYDATLDFVKEARAFAPQVRPEDVGQALRNVWIGNSLQMLLELPVRMTPSLFGYSMLYPWTDNYLDDPGVPRGVKLGFNERFGRRLAGEAVAAQGAHEQQVFELVARVEGEHDRRTRPEVFESLLAIQRAQVNSLAQQRAEHALSGSELLALSVDKGGASVLADAYLVSPSLAEDEALFAFGYGVFLQLLDDLQDVEVDRAAGHATLFSTATGPLDGLVSRLSGFMDAVISGSTRFSGPAFAQRLDLIRRNCRMLLVGAVAEHQRRFTRRFAGALEERWPFDFESMRRLHRHGERRYRRTMAILQRRRAVRSLLDLVA